MGKTNIGWAANSWNLYTWNCNRVSPGCANCYMFEMARNLHGVDATGTPSLRETAWAELQRLQPGPTFVNSMSDTYHEGVPLEWIQRIHNAALTRPDIVFLLLTKRIERAAELAPELRWPENLWIGTTVEHPRYLHRLDTLQGMTYAAGRFVSFEPLLADMGRPDLRGIEGVIAGGESGPKRRYFNKQWALGILAACLTYKVPFFFKQGSAHQPGQDRRLNGIFYDEVPKVWNWTPDGEHEAQTVQQQPLF